MSNNFENLKNTLIYFLSTREKKSKTQKPRKDLEESSFLIEYNDKALMRYSDDKDSRKYPLAGITSAKRIPFLYGGLGIILIISMITFSLTKNLNEDDNKLLYLEVGKSKIKILNFFRLPLINPLVYHLINSSYSLVGLGFLLSLFHLLNNKLINKKATRIEYFKLYLTISYGIISQLINLIYGVVYMSGSIEKINENFMNEMKISIFQLIFLIQIFFSVLFGIFTTIFKSKLQTKPSYSLENQENLEGNSDTIENKWFNYKIVAVFYLTFFTLAYLFVYLHSNNLILKTYNSTILKENYSYLLAVFPYFLYFNNLILYLTFYDELRDCNFYISQPGEEAENFEKRERNIL